MVELEFTKLSSKGQVVIPQKMREGFQEGEKFVVIKTGRQLILKSVADFQENIKKELFLAKRTVQALKRYGKGLPSTEDFFIARKKK